MRLAGRCAGAPFGETLSYNGRRKQTDAVIALSTCLTYDLQNLHTIIIDVGQGSGPRSHAPLPARNAANVNERKLIHCYLSLETFNCFPNMWAVRMLSFIRMKQERFQRTAALATHFRDLIDVCVTKRQKYSCFSDVNWTEKYFGGRWLAFLTMFLVCFIPAKLSLYFVISPANDKLETPGRAQWSPHSRYARN